MRLYYHAETDSAMLCFTDGPAAGNREIAENAYTMHDGGGKIIGIEVMGGAADFFHLPHRDRSIDAELVFAKENSV